MDEAEDVLIEQVRRLNERCDRLVETIKGLRADLKASREHADNISEELERLKRRLQALGTIEPGGEG